MLGSLGKVTGQYGTNSKRTRSCHTPHSLLREGVHQTGNDIDAFSQFFDANFVERVSRRVMIRMARFHQCFMVRFLPFRITAAAAALDMMLQI